VRKYALSVTLGICFPKNREMAGPGRPKGNEGRTCLLVLSILDTGLNS